MASNSALLASLRDMRRRLEAKQSRGGGYRPTRIVDPRTVRPSKSPTAIAPKPLGHEPHAKLRAAPEVQRLEIEQLRAERHADIDTLAVPEERRPLPDAPLRRLLGYLIRQWLRRWTARLEKRGR